MDLILFMTGAIIVLILTGWTLHALGFTQGYDAGWEEAYDLIVNGDPNAS